MAQLCHNRCKIASNSCYLHGYISWPFSGKRHQIQRPIVLARRKFGLDCVMADRLDTVTVGVAQERGVVGGVIVAQARRPVVGTAGRNAGVPERIDLCLPSRLEAPVAAERFFGLRPFADGEIDAVRIGGASPLAVAEPI